MSALAAVGKQLTSSEFFLHEAEKFKLKLTILQLAFALKRLQVKDDFRQRMSEAKKGIEAVTEKVNERMKAEKAKLNDFRDEFQMAYSHMKNAIEKL